MVNSQTYSGLIVKGGRTSIAGPDEKKKRGGNGPVKKGILVSK